MCSRMINSFEEEIKGTVPHFKMGNQTVEQLTCAKIVDQRFQKSTSH